MTRAEQSDLIMLLLNLSFIPDDVIKRMDNFKQGWQIQFKQHMDDWKQEKFQGEWKFQDP